VFEFFQAPAVDDTLDQKPSQDQKQPTSSDSGMLSLSEIEQLQQRAQEMLDYARQEYLKQPSRVPGIDD
jgi:hypothetical protein